MKRPAAAANAAPKKRNIDWKTWKVEFTRVENDGFKYKWKLLGLWLYYTKRNVNEKWNKCLICVVTTMRVSKVSSEHKYSRHTAAIQQP